MDRWILARLHQLTKDTTERLKKYIITETVRELGEFITDLSTWYVRRSRDRFKGTNEQDKQAAIATLHECLLTLAKLIAPFAPFLADSVYQDIGGKNESVHLEDWPVVDEALIDPDVLTDMERTREAVSRALERRAQAGVNVRQALSRMTLTVSTGEFDVAYIELIKDEVNVKEVVVQKGDHAVELDLVLTPELIREGMAREIIRRVNAMRKQVGLTIEDRIELYVSGNQEVMQTLKEHKVSLLHGTLANSVRTIGDIPENHDQFQLSEVDVTIGF